MLRTGPSVAVRLAATTVASDARAGASERGPSVTVAPLMSMPYATEGGSVPIYSMLHGRVQRRNWVARNPQWCDLCSEPVGQWLNHMGRKDHALLDMHYTHMVDWRRRWNPEELIKAFQDELHIDGITPFHQVISKEAQQSRNEVYAMLIKLEEAGMLYFGEAKDTYLHMMMGGLRGMDHQGALVLHECLFGPFMHLYPDAHIQDYSNLVDFITCSYNMETAYDLLGLYKLDKVALKAQLGPSSPAAMGLGGIATSSSATFGFKNESAVSDTVVTPQSAKMERDRGNIDDEAFSRKAAFMRQILGQLRWLLLPEQEHPAGYTFPEHIIVLGEICLKALVVQIVAARVVEYMVRVEPVWHNFGFERRKLNVQEIAKKRVDVVPRVFRYTHRALMPEKEDFYSNQSTKLDEYVAKGLTRKGLPVPKSFKAIPEAKSDIKTL